MKEWAIGVLIILLVFLFFQLVPIGGALRQMNVSG